MSNSLSPDEVRRLAARFARPVKPTKPVNPDVNRGRWGKVLHRRPARRYPEPVNAKPFGGLPPSLRSRP